MKLRRKVLTLMAVVMILTRALAVGEPSICKSNPQTMVLFTERSKVCSVDERGNGSSLKSFTKQTEVQSGIKNENGLLLENAAANVIQQVNRERARYGLQPLKVSRQLTEAAYIRAKEIVRQFSHTRPDGTSWSTVSSLALGENIAKGHSSADRVMAAWMTSEGHRRNILRESFGSIGVCAMELNGVLYWVQLFGR